MMFRLLALAFLLQSCVTTPAFVSQTGVIGSITASTGVPTVLRDGRPYMLGKESQLYAGDVVMTDHRSRVEAQLTSSSRLTVLPRSELHIENTASNGSAWRHVINLSRGALEITTGSSPESFEIRTNIASIRTANNSLWLGYSAGYRRIDVVSLGDNEVIVSNEDGEVQLNAPMEASAVLPGAAPQAKTVWSVSKLDATRLTYNQTE